MHWTDLRFTGMFVIVLTMVTKMTPGQVFQLMR